MKVVFCQFGDSAEYARMMVASCKRFGYEVWQLSDMVAPEIDGVDKLLREPMEGGRMLWRMKRLSEIEPPFVMLDTDMLVTRDISGGFGEDVALSSRKQRTVVHDGEMIPMPYNGGLLFISNAQFLKDCLREMQTMPDNWQDWYGDQIALRHIAQSGKYRVRELDEYEWNYVPESNAANKTARIWHFKGMRKPMMAQKWKEIC